MAEPCGAKTRSGTACKRPPLPNGRCKLHGGASTGPKDLSNNTNALKHGIYSEHFTDDEHAWVAALKLGTIDEELGLMKLRLKRALAAEALAKGLPEVESIIVRDGANKYVAACETSSKVKDYTAIIDRITGRIESLEKTRIALLEAQNGNSTTLPPDGLEVHEYAD